MHRPLYVLAIDDDPEMLSVITMMLITEGIDVLHARDAASALRTIRQTNPDAILLDMVMPEIDGVEACRRLRELTDAPIIFVTGNGAIKDIVQGLSVGGDDYLVKPFNRSELLSRLRASLQRAAEGTDGREAEILPPPASGVPEDGRHELMIAHKRVYLTPREFEVLRLLIRHAGKPLSASAILAEAWGPGEATNSGMVERCVRQLQQKIEPNPQSPRYLHAIQGQGYCFNAEPGL